MDNTELEALYQKDMERLDLIIESVILYGYKYNPKTKEFVVKFAYIQLKDIDSLSDLTKEEKHIISNNTNINEIIKELHSNFFKKHDNYSQTGKLLEYAKNIFSSDDIKILINNFENLHKLNQSILMLVLSRSIESTVALVEDKKSSMVIQDSNDINNYTQVLTKTISNAFITMERQNINIENKEFKDYKYIWETIKYIWINSLKKKKPNNVFSALENIFQFNTVSNSMLESLSSSIQVGYDYYLKDINDYRKVIVKTLVNVFITKDIFHANKDKFESVRQLCTATYKDKRIMDNRTFKKHIKGYEIIFAPEFKITNASLLNKKDPT